MAALLCWKCWFVTNGSLYRLPLRPELGGNDNNVPFTVAWGDGSAEQQCTSAVACSHNYTSAGGYNLTLYGAKIVGFTMIDVSLVLAYTCVHKRLSNGNEWRDTTSNKNCDEFFSVYPITGVGRMLCAAGIVKASDGTSVTQACCQCGGG